MPPRDPPHHPDEAQVRRWPRPARVIFLLAAGLAAWAFVIWVAWLAWRRLF